MIDDSVGRMSAASGTTGALGPVSTNPETVRIAAACLPDVSPADPRPCVGELRSQMEAAMTELGSARRAVLASDCVGARQLAEVLDDLASGCRCLEGAVDRIEDGLRMLGH